ncbi:hypothetical protein CAMGR0001_0467 [Campylobacter gracilis RM3268]|uniref:Uncharacterized protein n=1 Tax=Campylobacter gracilis RM3268 TaxID=553220 RepID=C8PHM2_9BACT|nr:hypothetical protein CAMGR0001_0467 [Campylobacter gracilis RM3268]
MQITAARVFKKFKFILKNIRNSKISMPKFKKFHKFYKICRSKF